MYSEKYEESVSHFNKALEYCDVSHQRNISYVCAFSFNYIDEFFSS